MSRWLCTVVLHTHVLVHRVPRIMRAVLSSCVLPYSR